MTRTLPARALAFGKLDQAIRTFGKRFARRMILRRSFGESHPVLSIEDDLVEMARSQLQEVILATVPGAEDGLRDELVISLRRAAADRISDSTEEEDTKAQMLLDVAREDFDDLFHTMH